MPSRKHNKRWAFLWDVWYTLQKTQQTVGIFFGIYCISSRNINKRCAYFMRYTVYPLESTTNGGHILWDIYPLESKLHFVVGVPSCFSCKYLHEYTGWEPAPTNAILKSVTTELHRKHIAQLVWYVKNCIVVGPLVGWASSRISNVKLKCVGHVMIQRRKASSEYLTFLPSGALGHLDELQKAENWNNVGVAMQERIWFLFYVLAFYDIDSIFGSCCEFVDDLYT